VTGMESNCVVNTMEMRDCFPKKKK